MISDFIKDSLRNINRNKKNYILITIITLLLFVLFVDIIFTKNIYTYIYNYKNKNLAFRTFNIYKYDNQNTQESLITNLKEIEHISDAYISKYALHYVDTDLNINNLSGRLTILHGSENTTPKSIKGKQIKDLMSGELICPYLFYPETKKEGYEIDEDKFINPDEIINLEFNVFYDKFTPTGEIVDGSPEEIKETLSKKFKIVGFYDNTITMNKNNECYGKESDIKVFADALNPPVENGNYNFQIVIDNANNLNKVSECLKNLGYEINSDSLMEIDKPTIIIIVSLTTSIFIIMTISIIYLLYNYLVKKIKDESKYIGILLSCGYTKEQIIIKQIMENNIILLIAFTISSFLFSITFFIIENKIPLFKYLTYIGFKVTNNFFLLLLILFILFIISYLINIKILKKSLKCPISNLLGEEL